MFKHIAPTRSLGIFGHKSPKTLCQTRGLFYAKLNALDNGTLIASLRNDRQPDESVNEYKLRSMIQFHSTLKPDYYYIYADRSSLRGVNLFPGHIAFFATSDKGEIIEDSCMSLRNSTVIDGERLHFKLEHDPTKQTHKRSVWNIRFLSIAEELNEFLFSGARDDVPLEHDRPRFITAIPQDLFPEPLEVVLEQIRRAKVDLKDSRYILADGYLIKRPNKDIKTFVNAVNCITGFYKAVSVTGKEAAPSVQMAKTGLLSLLLGSEAKDRLIEGTGLRREDDEVRRHDDVLAWESPKLK